MRSCCNPLALWGSSIRLGAFGDQPGRDAARDAILQREGFHVLRIAARDVLKDMDAVLSYIVATCSEVGPLHHDAARRGPPPRPGEESE